MENKSISIVATVLLCFVFMVACSPSAKEASNGETANGSGQKQMIVYGSNTCDHCINFKKKMDSLNIKYSFFDVEVDQTKADEMLKKLEEVRFMGYIAFPVVDIEGRVMVNPELSQVMMFVKK